MTIYTLQYDMGLRLWVLTGPKGQTLATWLSRIAALHDTAVRAIVERGGTLRIRNADGTYEPIDGPVQPEVVGTPTPTRVRIARPSAIAL
ncbi:hypothetical protein [Luteimonas terrae]|uniref:Uncharacterized protein n=1 Tax=Luteimonas terrae TaxID=1530191 RepID=A0A4R5U584_9GAMM|nr:hypothetical protein [Luteimonas terrae]TDK28997.1 hypothetical protein E2F49_15675 [Luteimonas terrae]